MTITQVELADAYTDPLPLSATLERMRMLLLDLEMMTERLEKNETALNAIDRLKMNIPPTAFARLENAATVAALNVATVRREIVNVARQIVAEDAAIEILAIGETE